MYRSPLLSAVSAPLSRKGKPIAEFSSKITESKAIYFADTVHPNDTGHTRLYETILQYLNTI